jgi:hypothetical protein
MNPGKRNISDKLKFKKFVNKNTHSGDIENAIRNIPR